MTYKIKPVHPEILPQVWHLIGPILDKAISLTPERVSLDDILTEIRHGEYLVWAVIRGEEIIAALTTRISQYPQARVLAIDFVAGKSLRQWMPQALEILERHAQGLGCIALEGYGRPAWGRVLEKFEWQPYFTVYKKDLKSVERAKDNQGQARRPQVR